MSAEPVNIDVVLVERLLDALLKEVYRPHGIGHQAFKNLLKNRLAQHACDLLDEMGSQRAVARALQVSEGLVRNWLDHKLLPKPAPPVRLQLLALLQALPEPTPEARLSVEYVKRFGLVAPAVFAEALEGLESLGYAVLTDDGWSVAEAVRVKGALPASSISPEELVAHMLEVAASAARDLLIQEGRGAAEVTVLTATLSRSGYEAALRELREARLEVLCRHEAVDQTAPDRRPWAFLAASTQS